LSTFFINRNFTWLWIGQSISNLGDMIFDTTLMLWIATIIARNQSWAPLASSGVLVVTALPTVVLGPLAGVFVDRWDKRRTLLVADAMRSLLILALLLFTGIIPWPVFAHMTPRWQISGIYLITLLTTICAQFFDPARFTLLTDVVEPEQRTKASGLGQAAQSIAAMIGPFIAAPLLFFFGVQWALILNAASFIISFLAILAVHPPDVHHLKEAVQPEKRPVTTTKTAFWQEFQEGMRFILHSRLIMALAISAGIVNFGGAAFETLYVYFALDNLHAPISLYGMFGLVAGLGTLLGALITAFFVKRLGEIRIFWLSFIISGILILILARQTQFYVALIVYFLMNCSFIAVNIVISPLLQRTIPYHLLGRVKGVLTPSMYLIMMLSTIFFGYLATLLRGHWHATIWIITFGPIDTIFTATGVILIIGGIYAWRMLPLFEID
jgi:MFS family permease